MQSILLWHLANSLIYECGHLAPIERGLFAFQNTPRLPGLRLFYTLLENLFDREIFRDPHFICSVGSKITIGTPAPCARLPLSPWCTETCTCPVRRVMNTHSPTSLLFE